VNTWHAHPNDLADYLTGTDDPILAASVETHLLRCAECRTALVRAAGNEERRAETERRWDALAAVVDRPTSSPLARMGLSTRPLMTAWGAALLFVLVVPILPAFFLGAGVPTLLLALAPLAPTLAVALAYRETADPSGEIALAVPLAGLRLVSRRALLVGIGAVPLGIAAALLLQLPLSLAVAWLLPGVALAALVLLAGTTRLDPGVVAAVLGVAWAFGVAVPGSTSRIPQDVMADAVGSPQTQFLALLVAAAALALTFSRRDHIAYRRSA
jgi:hypothetical protein